jgi:hypothetical protein
MGQGMTVGKLLVKEENPLKTLQNFPKPLAEQYCKQIMSGNTLALKNEFREKKLDANELSKIMKHCGKVNLQVKPESTPGTKEPEREARDREPAKRFNTPAS